MVNKKQEQYGCKIYHTPCITPRQSKKGLWNAEWLDKIRLFSPSQEPFYNY